MIDKIDVLIVGAGPTGLTAAVEAARHGLNVRIIDKNKHRSIESKALVVHARTLEIFRDLDLVDDVLASGKIFSALNIYNQDQPMARILFENLDWKDALYPFWLSLPQSETERCLEDKLNQLGVTVERQTELLGFEQSETMIQATVSHAGGHQETIVTSWLVGCDGARSKTRKILGLNFIGHADDEVFILADADLDTNLPEDEGYNILSPDGVVLIVPLPKSHQRRLIFHMPNLSGQDRPAITPDLLQSLLDTRAKLDIQVVGMGWTSSFTVKHFVASNHRQGRAFLAGDAAHIHSPVGGQGMNSGIQDAYNLMWKLAMVHKGQAKPLLLDSYEHERHQVAEHLIQRVNLATKIVTLNHPVGQTIRNRVGNILINTDMVQNQLGRSVAMLDIHYRDSPIVSTSRRPQSAIQKVTQVLSQPDHDSSDMPEAGDRAPNVVTSMRDKRDTKDMPDLYSYLYGTHHTAVFFMGRNNKVSIKTVKSFADHVRKHYQAIIRPLIITTTDKHIENDARYPMIYDDSGGEMHRAYGADEPSIYLIRPDLYIGYRSQPFDLDQLTTYLDQQFI